MKKRRDLFHGHHYTMRVKDFFNGLLGTGTDTLLAMGPDDIPRVVFQSATELKYASPDSDGDGIPDECQGGEDCAGPSKVYWTAGTIGPVGNLCRADLDGSDVECPLDDTDGVLDPRGIAVDAAAGKMYWADTAHHSIRRANLDGTDIEELCTELSAPHGLALNLETGDVYWTDTFEGAIYKLGADRICPEAPLLDALGTPGYLVLDVDGNQMYWGDTITNTINSADLDEGVPSPLPITGLVSPSGIALDLINGKLYWSDMTLNIIQRSNLDGSNVETVCSDLGDEGFEKIDDIEVDPIGGMIYWAGRHAESISRADIANCDATRTVLVDTSPYQPVGIALDLTTVEPDCNGNGVCDDQDIANGTSPDCNENGIPDECELDTDGDGLIDDCDPDCDNDGLLNEDDVCPCYVSLGGVDTEGRPLGDFDLDCDVDLVDYETFAANFVNGAECLNGDANKDGAIDPLDSGYVLARLGDCP